jgi:hypothetical protein
MSTAKWVEMRGLYGQGVAPQGQRLAACLNLPEAWAEGL